MSIVPARLSPRQNARRCSLRTPYKKGYQPVTLFLHGVKLCRSIDAGFRDNRRGLPGQGIIKWFEYVEVAYYAQDDAATFDSDMLVFDWMSQWGKVGDDEQAIRGVIGRIDISKYR